MRFYKIKIAMETTLVLSLLVFFKLYKARRTALLKRGSQLGRTSEGTLYVEKTKEKEPDVTDNGIA